ncbi:MAG: hypothetical protein AAB911_01100 [Patescibacteria group bacterium]
MKKFAQIKLTVSILKQDSRYIVYSPALDLSTSGRTGKEAKKRFEEASLLLIEELDKAGTLHDVLRELGWRQAQKRWSPPKIISQEAVGVRMPVAA